MKVGLLRIYGIALAFCFFAATTSAQENVTQNGNAPSDHINRENWIILDDQGRIMILINWNSDMGDGWEHTYDADYPTKCKSAITSRAWLRGPFEGPASNSQLC
jgi:hypothetical protein